ncbi:peptidase [Xenorhabdus szentirmaii]|uniref:Uncharacterized protein n=1 Tax=Xenorhabdus szentirmaii DSM 16338 TaxID=1427518 RepID=W1J3S2_9GAMM|nr:peptidase [Xenorhabdus szentirmaii DSM 16338]PHM44237.1 peptidase [Xenorhabdus szentirmaii]CDL84723.1 conserved hypothetical protein [Xenorhabdus szentirmaii DSM 16338]
MALGVAMYMGGYYCTEYMKQLSINNNQITEIQQLTDRINYQNTHIEMLHELDAKYTQELTNAKSKITQLGDDLRTHVKRMYVKVECPVSETPSPASVDGSGPARLAKDAEQDYVRLLG